jgi:hypothetical protein
LARRTLLPLAATHSETWLSQMERFSSPLIIEPPIDQTLSSKNCIAWISHSLTFWWVPTSNSPSWVKATAEGAVLGFSAFSITWGFCTHRYGMN